MRGAGDLVIADPAARQDFCAYPCVPSAPDGVVVRKIDLSTELKITSFREPRQAASAQKSVHLLEVVT